MIKCPNCKKDISKPNKTWKYSRAGFTVQAYLCINCGTAFREYTKNGKRVFILKLEKGKGFIKA